LILIYIIIYKLTPPVFLIEKKNWPTVGESRKAPIAAKNGTIIKLLHIKLKYADRNTKKVNRNCSFRII